MNYLAHSYLSFNQPEILVGNIISDFVKGKKQFDFETEIQKGIQLHRAIDSFTDKHTSTKKAIEVFKPEVGLYAGAFIDVVYDYFLANDKARFKDDDALFAFVQNVYATIDEYKNILPLKFSQMFIYMKTRNWLYNYKHKPGINMSFKGITRRAKYINHEHKCFEIFVKNIEPLQDCYNNFINDIEQMVLQ